MNSKVLESIMIGSLIFAIASQISPALADPIASERENRAIKFIRERQDLRGSDLVDWSVLKDTGTPAGPFTLLPAAFSLTSPKGSELTVNIPPATATAGPPVVGLTGPSPLIQGTFQPGLYVLFTGGGDPRFPEKNNPSPITITFAKPVFGAGAALQPDDGCRTMCPYRGIIEAYDKNNQLIASFSTPGISSQKLDGSTPFLGVLSKKENISKIVFSIDPAITGPNPIGIGPLELTTTKPIRACENDD
jgi:hypothetical protein